MDIQAKITAKGFNLSTIGGIMGSYKTTVAGIVTAAAAFVVFAAGPPYHVQFPTWAIALAGFINMGGIATMGALSKDHDVTGGGTIGKPSTAEALIESHEVKPEDPPAVS